MLQIHKATHLDKQGKFHELAGCFQILWLWYWVDKNIELKKNFISPLSHLELVIWGYLKLPLHESFPAPCRQNHILYFLCLHVSICTDFH